MSCRPDVGAVDDRPHAASTRSSPVTSDSDTNRHVNVSGVGNLGKDTQSYLSRRLEDRWMSDEIACEPDKKSIERSTTSYVGIEALIYPMIDDHETS